MEPAKPEENAINLLHILSPKRGHTLPPSKATHPKDRWETLYVYMFIRRFTTLKDEIIGFLSPEECVYHPSNTFDGFVLTFVGSSPTCSLERALLDPSGEPEPLLENIILRFILNLRPNTRNTRHVELC